MDADTDDDADVDTAAYDALLTPPPPPPLGTFNETAAELPLPSGTRPKRLLTRRGVELHTVLTRNKSRIGAIGVFRGYIG
jgi:hypothetical protein